VNPLFLTGRDRSKMVHAEDLGCDLHAEVVDPLRQLQTLAREHGHNLAVISAYRGFERQLIIWNDKVAGKRPVLNKSGQVQNLALMTDWEKVQAILTWSALPGASRHHWGTDFDVYDPDCLPPDYRLQLTRDEYDVGVLQPFNQWLGEWLDAGRGDFFRPFNRDTGGISPEPWHISYRPLADQFQVALSLDTVIEAWEQADLALKDCVISHAQEIFSRFIQVPS